MYKRTFDERNNRKVEFRLNAPMLHESYLEFIRKVEDAVRELGDGSYSDITITVD